MTSSNREAFERYFLESRKSKGANRKPTLARLPDDTYVDDHTQRHWWTWQNASAMAHTSGRVAGLQEADEIVVRAPFKQPELDADAWTDPEAAHEAGLKSMAFDISTEIRDIVAPLKGKA